MQSDTTYLSSSDWSTLGFLLTHVTTCCNLPRKCTPVKYKVRQKAGFPIVTYTTSYETFLGWICKNIVLADVNSNNFSLALRKRIRTLSKIQDGNFFKNPTLDIGRSYEFTSAKYAPILITAFSVTFKILEWRW